MNITITKSRPDVAWVSKTSEKLFGGYGDIMIPFNPKLIRNLMGELGKKVYAFHVQSAIDLPATVSIQNSRKTISASRNKILNPDKWKGPSSRPRLPQTNVIVKIQGDMILGNSLDIFSMPDEKGMRWVSANNLRFNLDSSSAANADKSINSDDFAGVFEPIIKEVEKWKKKNQTRLQPLYEEYQKNKSKKSSNEVDANVQKEKFLLIKDFFDVVEKAFTNNKESIAKEYSRLLSNTTTVVQKGLKNYDEFLISNFKIVSVYVPKTSEFVDKEQIKNMNLTLETNETTFYKLT